MRERKLGFVTEWTLPGEAAASPVPEYTYRIPEFDMYICMYVRMVCMYMWDIYIYLGYISVCFTLHI